MKTINVLLAISVMIGSLTMTGCGDDTPKAKYDGVTLKIDGVDLDNVLSLNLADKTYNVKVDVNPESVTMTPQEFQYAIKDQTIATVDENGLITMLNEGETKLTVRINIKNDVWTTCILKVTPLTATGLNVPESVSLNIGTSRDLANDISVEPIGATKRLNYQVANPAVATVNNEGVLTGVSEGETTLTVSTMDGSNLSKSIAIQVSNKVFITEIQYPLEDITNAKFVAGQALNVNEFATILPEDAEDKKLKYSVKEGDGIVAVTEDGIATCISKGTATILVEAQDGSGVKKEVTINVSDNTGWCDRSLWGITSAPVQTGKPEDILDGDFKTFLSIRKPEWFAEPAYNEIYFIIDTHGKATFNYAYYEHRHENVKLAADKIDISGSDDGESYTIIKDNIDIPYQPSVGPIQFSYEIELPQSSYRYIKVQVTSWPLTTVNGGGSAVQISEFKLGNYNN